MKVSVRAMLLALSLSFFAGQAHAVPFFSKKPEQTAQPAPLNLANSNADTGKSKFGLPKLPWSSDKEVEPMSEPLVERNVSPEQQLEGQISLARLSERRGQVEQAEEMYKALVARHPRLAVPRHRLGVIEARRGNYEAADHHFQAALSIDPHNAELLSDAAYSCYLQNRFEEAEALYKRAYTAAPNDARLCNNYGMLLTELGHVDQALAMFRKATSEAEAHANVGYVLVQLGEFDQARKHFDYALTLNPELRSAAHALLQLAEQGERAKLAKLAPQNQPSASERQPESLVQAIGEQMNSPAAIVDANSQRSGGAPQASLPRSMPNASAGEPTRATPVESRNFAPIEAAAVETPRPAASPLPTPYARPTSPTESTAVELGSNYAARMQPAASARRTPTAEEAKQPTETNWPGAQPVAVASDVPGASSPRIASEQLPIGKPPVAMAAPQPLVTKSERIAPIYRSSEDPQVKQRMESIAAAEAERQAAETSAKAQGVVTAAKMTPVEVSNTPSEDRTPSVASHFNTRGRGGMPKPLNPTLPASPLSGNGTLNGGSIPTPQQMFDTANHLAPIVSPQEMQQRHVQQIQEQMLAPAGLSANKGPRALNLNPHANAVRPIQQSSSLPPIQSTTGPTPAADSPNSAAAPAAAPATTRAVKPQSSSGGTGLSRFFSTK